MSEVPQEQKDKYHIFSHLWILALSLQTYVFPVEIPNRENGFHERGETILVHKGLQGVMNKKGHIGGRGTEEEEIARETYQRFFKRFIWKPTTTEAS